MRWNDLSGEACPVARGLSVVGDRWTMLVLRDCFLGIRRFERMQERLGITRHVLADRLRKLEAAGVLRREPYQQRPVRHEYRLTERGKALYPVLVALIGWAEQHVPGPAAKPGADPGAGRVKSAVRLVSRESGAPVAPVLVDANTGRPITHRDVLALRDGEPER